MPSAHIDVVYAAQRALDAFSPLTDPHWSQRAELTASGVPRHRIDALYPFSLADHVPALCALLNDQQTFWALGQQLDASDIVGTFSHLFEAERLEAEGLLEEATIAPGQLIYRASKLSPALTSGTALTKWLMLLAFFHICSHRQLRHLPAESDFVARLRRHIETSRGLIAYLPPPKKP